MDSEWGLTIEDGDESTKVGSEVGATSSVVNDSNVGAGEDGVTTGVGMGGVVASEAGGVDLEPEGPGGDVFLEVVARRGLGSFVLAVVRTGRGTRNGST